MKKFIINSLARICDFFIKILPPAVAYKNMPSFGVKLDEYNNAFTSYLTRPKYADDISYKPLLKSLNVTCAIVIQGPIIAEDNFTVETVKLYKINFPSHRIIVSTWNDTSKEHVSSLMNLNVELVLNEKPSNYGPLNINLQILSSISGIKKAKELGANYVFKTRTDQRIYNNSISEFLISLVNLFPLPPNSKLNKRLIACSFTTLKYRLYGLGDMLMFGDVDDMLLYWNADLDFREIMKSELKNLSSKEYAKLRLAETYLCSNFLDRIGYSLKWTIRDTWQVYRDYFCVVDKETFNLFWYKYDWRNERRFESFQEDIMNCLKFNEWLVINQQLLDDLYINEEILNQREV